MTITTKFDKGDTVFFIHKGKVIEDTVMDMIINGGFNFVTFKYKLSTNLCIDEEFLFSSKQELIQSL